MKTIYRMTVIKEDRCIGCASCAKVCPVNAIERLNESKKFAVNGKICSGCGLCLSECDQSAIELVRRSEPVVVGISNVEVTENISRICAKAHMYPEQTICFCHLVKAKEIVAAILQGGDTPEAISQMTGVRTGCGVLCISAVIRLLRAAGIELKKAPGSQWYGMDVSIWDMPDSIQKKYSQYFVKEDLEIINEYFPKGGEK